MHNFARAGVIAEMVHLALRPIGGRDSHTNWQVSIPGVCVTTPFAGKLCIEKVAQVMGLKVFLGFIVSDLRPTPARGPVLSPTGNVCMGSVSHFWNLSVCVCVCSFRLTGLLIFVNFRCCDLTHLIASISVSSASLIAARFASVRARTVGSVAAIFMHM